MVIYQQYYLIYLIRKKTVDNLDFSEFAYSLKDRLMSLIILVLLQQILDANMDCLCL